MYGLETSINCYNDSHSSTFFEKMERTPDQFGSIQDGYSFMGGAASAWASMPNDQNGI
jgi:hypothetical protein